MALIHGGDTEGYLLEYGSKPLDFSANCNPLGIPKSVPRAVGKAAVTADEYPDPLCRRLGAALSEKLGVEKEHILFGNGAADLIFRLALAEKPKTAVVTAPTFAEYELALRTVSCEVERHALIKAKEFCVTETILDRIAPGTDMLFICNPNNPTGRTVDTGLMSEILAACEKTGTLLVVDECFNGFLDRPEKHSLKKKLPEHDNLLILDAFTKLYGMAGVRLGYCLSGNTKLLGRMKDAGQPWSVSSLAQAAGLAALKEDAYVARAQRLVGQERAYLTEALDMPGVKPLGGEANFIFLHSDIPGLTVKLRERGILIRDCGNYPRLNKGYYRIAVRTHKENIQLISVLRELSGNKCINEKKEF
jgi:threonine-phosphate decarboxylase